MQKILYIIRKLDFVGRPQLGSQTNNTKPKNLKWERQQKKQILQYNSENNVEKTVTGLPGGI